MGVLNTIDSESDCYKPVPSLFVSGRLYFISRMEVNNTGNVTFYITLHSPHPQSLELFPDKNDHYRTFFA